MSIGFMLKNAKETYVGPSGNIRSEYEDFAVSFSRGIEAGPFRMLSGIFAADNTTDGETALCVGESHYILNGDWRLAYDELAPQGVPACLDFFRAKAPLFASSWSDEL